MDRLSWVDLQERLEEAVRPVLEKHAQPGAAAPNKSERLIYSVWFANYCMSNAGDLANATDENGEFLKEVAALALELAMSHIHAAFALPQATFEASYDELLEEIVIELEGKTCETE